MKISSFILLFFTLLLSSCTRSVNIINDDKQTSSYVNEDSSFEDKVKAKFDYEYLHDFHDGRAYMKSNGKRVYLDNNANIVFENSYDMPHLSEFLICDNPYDDNFSDSRLPVNKNGIWGYVDLNGKLVIDLQYESARPFTDGLAKVVVNGLHGIIDIEGNEVIPLKYSYLYSSSEGLIGARKSGLFGFIDSNDQTVIPFIYESVEKFINEFAVVQNSNGMYGMIDKQGDIQVPFNYLKISPDCCGSNIYWGKTENGYVLIDEEGKPSAELYEQKSRFIDGYTAVLKDSKWGVIDLYGLQILPFEYEDITIYSSNLFRVVKNEKEGLVNNSNEVILDIIYDKLRKEKDEYILKLANKYGVKNFKGETKIPFDYDQIIKKGNTYIIRNNKSWGALNNEGKMIVPIEFTKIRKVDFNLLQIEKDSLLGLQTAEGFQVLACKYDGIQVLINQTIICNQSGKFNIKDFKGDHLTTTTYKSLEYVSDSIYIASDGEQKFLIDLNGKLILDQTYEDLQFTRVGTFKAYNKNTGYGLLDKDLNILLKVEHEEIGEYSELRASILNDKYGFVDEYGKQVIPCKYDHVTPFSSGKSIVTLNNKKGIINRRGSELLAIKYDKIKSFIFGFAKIEANGKVGSINNVGEIVIPVAYDDLHWVGDIQNRKAIVKSNGYYGLLDETGEVLRPMVYSEMRKFYGSDVIITRKEGKEGLLNFHGDVVIDFIYDKIKTNKGNYKVYLDQKVGIIDKNGNIIKPLVFDELYFSDGKKYWGKVDSTYILYTEKGEILKEYIFDKFESRGERYRVSYNGKIGELSKDEGEVLIPIEYESFKKLKNGNYWASKDSKFGLIDPHGSELTEFNFDNVITKSYRSRNDIALASVDGKYGLYDGKGNELVEPKYWSISHEGSEFIISDESHKYGVIDTVGNILIPIKYENIFNSYKNRYHIQNDGKWGLATSSHEFIADIEYDEKLWPNYEVYTIIKDGKKGLIKSTGESIITTELENVRFVMEPGYIGVKKNDHWGFVDMTGKLVMPYTFDHINSFSGHKGHLEVLLDEKTFYLDYNLKCGIDCPSEEWFKKRGLSDILN